MASEPMNSYPLTYDVEYPEQGVGRVSILFRLFLVIPGWIVDGLLAGTTTLPLMLMLLFRKKYPRWWFDFNLERARFSARVGVQRWSWPVSASTALLITDRYPPFRMS